MAQVQRLPRHQDNWLLAALEPEDLAHLEPDLEVVILPKGTILYEAGDTIRYTYFPHDAIVGLINVMEDGQFVEVASFGREGLFGLISAIVSREAFGRYKVQVPGTASRIALDRMQQAMRTRATLRRLVLSYSEALLAQTFQTASCNAIHTAEARCCSWILNTRDRVDEDVLPLTHADLAEFLGVQRSTISIALGTLQTRGLITQQRGGIIIADRAGLEELACECYGKIRQIFARLLPMPPSWAS
ncbi:Crp/Fnr family transcriptional regulator [Microvirga sp. VF16]|uniref:Crp/Fnr family transcriptional regulator n=1 Tax=Microvirga sp. VF16 TaxID=2807101 RepID=UPI00193DC4B5|nr:Crp/Fnr family transcriptional regulator [Microvirga sp. VF16]QRM27358.1 Crp/Fnr family transcriptional regulator [Microvirga sp. VF16]